jgi:hypothetical protein
MKPSDDDDVRWTGPALMLIAVNCVPLVGVVLWGWSLFEIVVLYWFENLVIGAINALKMLTCIPDAAHLKLAAAEEQSAAGRKRFAQTSAPAAGQAVGTGESDSAALRKAAVGHQVSKLLMVPFFSFHYGFFCIIHGVFVFSLLGRDDVVGPGGPIVMLRAMLTEVLGGGLWFAALALIASHLYSYLFHFLWRGELRRTYAARLFLAPYGRIVVLHIAILLGAFATLVLGQPVILLLLLIIGKTLLDWQMHQREHMKAKPDRTVA